MSDTVAGSGDGSRIALARRMWKPGRLKIIGAEQDAQSMDLTATIDAKRRRIMRAHASDESTALPVPLNAEGLAWDWTCGDCAVTPPDAEDVPVPKWARLALVPVDNDTDAAMSEDSMCCGTALVPVDNDTATALSEEDFPEDGEDSDTDAALRDVAPCLCRRAIGHNVSVTVGHNVSVMVGNNNLNVSVLVTQGDIHMRL